MFTENGGDGFYGCLALNTDETVMVNKPFLGNYIPYDCKNIIKKLNDNNSKYPIANTLQPQLMQFKTGYRDMDIAAQSINALKITINKIENND